MGGINPPEIVLMDVTRWDAAREMFVDFDYPY
jgi:hypothetical protein